MFGALDRLSEENDHKTRKEEHKRHKYSLWLWHFLSIWFVSFVFFFARFVVKMEGSYHENRAMDAAIGEVARSRAG